MTSPDGELAKNVAWKEAIKTMESPNDFINLLKSMDIDNIPRENMDKVKQNCTKHDLWEGGSQSPEVIAGRSEAAGGLANWVTNIIKYDDRYQMITPLRYNLAEALANLDCAEEALGIAMAEVAALECKLNQF